MSDAPHHNAADVDRAIGMCRSHGLHGTEKLLLALQAENKAREAERDKLREALKDALDKILTLYAWSDQVGLYDIEETPAVVKARAALAETEDKTND